MITSALIQQLKQSNISKNGEKTSKRVQKVWKAATSDQKAAVCELSGSAKATVYRIFKTGGISAKLALAMGKVLYVDPLYLTGELDEPGEYADADALELLVRLGYTKLLAEHEKAQRRAQRDAAKQVRKDELSAEDDERAELKDAPSNEIVTSADILVLLQALEIRAKAGIPEARELLRQIKLLLLSA